MGFKLNYISISGTGQYQIAAALEEPEKSGVFLSNDYGETWLELSFNNMDSTKTIYGVSISSTGQYLSIAASKFIMSSSNFGKTWTKYENVACSFYNPSISFSGKYQIAPSTTVTGGPGKIFVSENYGETWSDYGSVGIWRSSAISSNGQFVAVADGLGGGVEPGVLETVGVTVIVGVIVGVVVEVGVDVAFGV